MCPGLFINTYIFNKFIFYVTNVSWLINTCIANIFLTKMCPGLLTPANIFLMCPGLLTHAFIFLTNVSWLINTCIYIFNKGVLAY